jgi:hypothetical protein
MKSWHTTSDQVMYCTSLLSYCFVVNVMVLSLILPQVLSLALIWYVSGTSLVRLWYCNSSALRLRSALGGPAALLSLSLPLPFPLPLPLLLF